jgi:hypothetical protein
MTNRFFGKARMSFGESKATRARHIGERTDVRVRPAELDEPSYARGIGEPRRINSRSTGETGIAGR